MERKAGIALLGFLSHKVLSVTDTKIKGTAKQTIPLKECYSVTQEVYCWQVAPQQSLIPLQLPGYKGNSFIFDIYKILNKVK